MKSIQRTKSGKGPSMPSLPDPSQQFRAGVDAFKKLSKAQKLKRLRDAGIVDEHGHISQSFKDKVDGKPVTANKA